jgi:sugar lactone lactonase YvrE
MKYTLSILIFLIFPLTAHLQVRHISPLSQDEFYVSEDFTQPGLFTNGIEGPAVDSKGNLYAVNFNKSGTIGIVDSFGTAKLFATLPSGSTGNGIRFDKQENMYIADYTGHNVLLIPSGKNTAEVYCHNTGFNQPNDLAIMSNGILFASDPVWTGNSGKLWRINTDKTADLLEENMGTTNGIEVSPNDQFLYVNESNQFNVWRYNLSVNGEVSDKILFTTFSDEYGMDGMRCDNKGNLYITRYGKGVVAIFSPEGNLLREVHLKGTEISNIAFGGSDGQTCFVTVADRKIVEKFRTETSGREWSFFQNTTDIRIGSIGNSQIELFPNPSTLGVHLKNINQPSDVSIIDCRGNIIFMKKGVKDYQYIDVSSWNTGLYIIRIQNTKSITMKNLIIE